MEIKIKEDEWTLSDPSRVMECINDLWKNFPEYDKGRENMIVLYLNVKNVLISAELHAQGTIDQAIIYPREVIRKGLFCNAAGMIMIHNHPSGYCTPSNHDKELTTRIKDCAKMMDIHLLDHIIIGKNDHYSFQKESIL